MAEHEHHDHDAEDSEYGGPVYGPAFHTSRADANYITALKAWAGFATLVAVSVIAYMWIGKDSAELTQNNEILRNDQEMIRLMEQNERQDQRMDFIQKEVERLQRP